MKRSDFKICAKTIKRCVYAPDGKLLRIEQERIIPRPGMPNWRAAQLQVKEKYGVIIG